MLAGISVLPADLDFDAVGVSGWCGGLGVVGGCSMCLGCRGGRFGWCCSVRPVLGCGLVCLIFRVDAGCCDVLFG